MIVKVLTGTKALVHVNFASHTLKKRSVEMNSTQNRVSQEICYQCNIFYGLLRKGCQSCCLN